MDKSEKKEGEEYEKLSSLHSQLQQLITDAWKLPIQAVDNVFDVG